MTSNTCLFYTAIATDTDLQYATCAVVRFLSSECSQSQRNIQCQVFDLMCTLSSIHLHSIDEFGLNPAVCIIILILHLSVSPGGHGKPLDPS